MWVFSFVFFLMYKHMQICSRQRGQRLLILDVWSSTACNLDFSKLVSWEIHLFVSDQKWHQFMTGIFIYVTHRMGSIQPHFRLTGSRMSEKPTAHWGHTSYCVVSWYFLSWTSKLIIFILDLPSLFSLGALLTTKPVFSNFLTTYLS